MLAIAYNTLAVISDKLPFRLPAFMDGWIANGCERHTPPNHHLRDR